MKKKDFVEKNYQMPIYLCKHQSNNLVFIYINSASYFDYI